MAVSRCAWVLEQFRAAWEANRTLYDRENVALVDLLADTRACGFESDHVAAIERIRTARLAPGWENFATLTRRLLGGMLAADPTDARGAKRLRLKTLVVGAHLFAALGRFGLPASVIDLADDRLIPYQGMHARDSAIVSEFKALALKTSNLHMEKRACRVARDSAALVDSALDWRAHGLWSDPTRFTAQSADLYAGLLDAIAQSRLSQPCVARPLRAALTRLIEEETRRDAQGRLWHVGASQLESPALEQCAFRAVIWRAMGMGMLERNLTVETAEALDDTCAMVWSKLGEDAELERWVAFGNWAARRARPIALDARLAVRRSSRSAVPDALVARRFDDDPIEDERAFVRSLSGLALARDDTSCCKRSRASH